MQNLDKNQEYGAEAEVRLIIQLNSCTRNVTFPQRN